MLVYAKVIDCYILCATPQTAWLKFPVLISCGYEWIWGLHEHSQIIKSVYWWCLFVDPGHYRPQCSCVSLDQSHLLNVWSHNLAGNLWSQNDSPHPWETMLKCGWSSNKISLNTKHGVHRLDSFNCFLPASSSPPLEVGNILSCPQTEPSSSPVCLPSVLCWHLKGWCGPEHLGVMPLGLRCPLSLSAPLCFFGPAGSAQSCQYSFARAKENGLCLEFEHGYADLG